MKVTRFSPNGLDSVLGGALTGTVTNSGSTQAINGTVVLNAAASNYHIVAVGSNEAYWLPHDASSSSVAATTMHVPVMVTDAGTGLWYVLVTGDGDAVMTEVPL